MLIGLVLSLLPLLPLLLVRALEQRIVKGESSGSSWWSNGCLVIVTMTFSLSGAGLVWWGDKYSSGTEHYYLMGIMVVITLWCIYKGVHLGLLSASARAGHRPSQKRMHALTLRVLFLFGLFTP